MVKARNPPGASLEHLCTPLRQGPLSLVPEKLSCLRTLENRHVTPLASPRLKGEKAGSYRGKKKNQTVENAEARRGQRRIPAKMSLSRALTPVQTPILSSQGRASLSCLPAPVPDTTHTLWHALPGIRCTPKVRFSGPCLSVSLARAASSARARGAQGVSGETRRCLCEAGLRASHRQALPHLAPTHRLHDSSACPP